MKYVTLKTGIMRLAFYTLALISVSKCANGVPNGLYANDTDTYLSRFLADLWLEGADIVRIIWRDCSKKLIELKGIDHKEYYPKFVSCMKRKTLRALDRCLSPDVVPVVEGVNLVRFELVDHSGNILHNNETSSWTDKELEENEWRTLALQRMSKVLRTHVIKFDFEDNINEDKVEYRGRRRHQLMTMMMFGIVSIGMVFIPMGFQFLAVLGGKALLLAKMALILASIQGLKKIATSPISYGFYHSFPYDHYEKRSGDWPSSGVDRSYTDSPNSFAQIGDLKIDRNLAKSDIDKGIIEQETEILKKRGDADVKQVEKMFPDDRGVLNSPLLTVVNVAATPLIDLTKIPQVQADFELDLPYNRLHFQNSPPVIQSL